VTGMGQILTVNVGHAVDAAWAGRIKRTAIDKQPVSGRVPVRPLGIGDDEQADHEHHGGADQAVYAYAREDLDWWQERLGRDLRNGIFGENLTVMGLDVNGAMIGERWQVGGALLEVTSPRVPCGVFRNWMNEKGWAKRFTEAERTGAYFRVIEEGEVAAGDPAVIEHRPEDGVTVTQSFHAYHGDQDLMRRLLKVPGLSEKWQPIADHVLRRA
jgi:MOSC domain-containing protein YiiM